VWDRPCQQSQNTFCHVPSHLMLASLELWGCHSLGRKVIAAWPGAWKCCRCACLTILSARQCALSLREIGFRTTDVRMKTTQWKRTEMVQIEPFDADHPYKMCETDWEQAKVNMHETACRCQCRLSYPESPAAANHNAENLAMMGFDYSLHT
jgi:hypothetical protein